MGWRKDGTDANRWVVKTGVTIKEIAKVPESHRNKKSKKMYNDIAALSTTML